MIKDALEYIVSMRAPLLQKFGDRDYSDKTLHPIQENIPTPIEVGTLTGFIDAVGLCLDDHNADDSFIHITDELTVELISQDTDTWARRTTHVRGKCATTNRFGFGIYIQPEHFIIALQAMFTSSGDRDKLVKLCGSLTSELSATAQDDGISQTAVTRKGVAIKEATVINPRVSLAPYRTFREVDQPVSEFLFRLRAQDGKPPECALFEADGGKWKIDAAENVRAYIATKLAAFKTVL